MSVESILLPIIREELAKYQRDGHKIKCKTVAARRLMYTICFVHAAILTLPIAFIPLIIYIVFMLKTSPEKHILYIAENNPDTPIDEIVAREVVVL